MPLVSVLVNTFNHERFISQALTSVIQQDFPSSKMEIIVVDDGSTDATPEIAQKFLPRIRFIRKPNGGQVSALHEAMTVAIGDIAAFLDGDDWWAKDKIAKVVAAFQKYPTVAAIGHGYHEVDEQGAILRTMTLDSECLIGCETPERARFAANLRVFGGTSRLAMRMYVLRSVLPVPSALPFFDNFIFTQAFARSGAVLLPEPLCFYRLHSSNLYASDSLDEQLLQRKHKLLCELIKYLPSRLARIGMSDETVAAVLFSDHLEAERLGLILNGGSPWQTFRLERSAFRNAYQKADIGYKLYKNLVFILTLVTTPKTFYRLQRWYTKHNLMRIRQWIGKGTLKVPEVKSRIIRRNDT